MGSRISLSPQVQDLGWLVLGPIASSGLLTMKTPSVKIRARVFEHGHGLDEISSLFDRAEKQTSETSSTLLLTTQLRGYRATLTRDLPCITHDLVIFSVESRFTHKAFLEVDCYNFHKNLPKLSCLQQ